MSLSVSPEVRLEEVQIRLGLFLYRQARNAISFFQTNYACIREVRGMENAKISWETHVTVHRGSRNWLEGRPKPKVTRNTPWSVDFFEYGKVAEVARRNRWSLLRFEKTLEMSTVENKTQEENKQQDRTDSDSPSRLKHSSLWYLSFNEFWWNMMLFYLY